VMHYAGVWGCSRPIAAASMKGSMTASMRKHGRTHRHVLNFQLPLFVFNWPIPQVSCAPGVRFSKRRTMILVQNYHNDPSYEHSRTKL